MTKLSAETRQKLMGVSTATLCTALFKRGLRNQFIQDVRPLNGNLPNMVGEAFTLRYIPAREDLNPITVFQTGHITAQGGGGMSSRCRVCDRQPQRCACCLGARSS